MADVRAKLAEKELTLPVAAKPLAAYVPATKSGKLVFTAGQLPLVNGEMAKTGKVGADVSVEEAKQLAKNESLKAELEETADVSNVQNTYSEGGYEADARKTDTDVVTSGLNSEQLPGFMNANLFGSKLASLPNKDNIRAVLVTTKNQDKLGLPNFIQTFIERSKQNSDEEVNADDVIIMMMVEQKGKSIKKVGIDGRALTGANSNFDNYVFQAMPSEKLRWSKKFGGGSMFRDAEVKERQPVIESLSKQYKAWRETILQSPEIKTYEVAASFGIGDKSKEGNEIGKAHV